MPAHTHVRANSVLVANSHSKVHVLGWSAVWQPARPPSLRSSVALSKHHITCFRHGICVGIGVGVT